MTVDLEAEMIAVDQLEQAAEERGLAWLAGLVDGDGCFSLTRKPKSGHFDVYFSLSSIYRPALDRAQRVLGVGRIITSTGNRTTLLRAHSTDACYAAALLHPFLRNKQESAGILCRYHQLARPAGGRRTRGTRVIKPIRQVFEHRRLLLAMARIRREFGGRFSNQPGRSANLAWAAGLFDAEGSLSISNDLFSCRVGLGMCHEPTVRAFGEVVGVGAIYPYSTYRVPYPTFSACAKAAWSVLTQLTPYLVIKQRQSELALEFLATIGRRGRPVTALTMERRLQLRTAICELNQLS